MPPVVKHLGVERAATSEEATEAELTGATRVDPSELAARSAHEAQRAAFDNWGDKAGTFIEGAADALSFGAIHSRGDAADVRRDVNSGSALAGELAGTVIGMKVPLHPLAKLSGGGEALGEALAKGLSTGKVVSSGFREAGVGAALTGAGAFGHQAFDALIENKDFSAEAVAKDAGLGSLLGFGAGILSGGLAGVRKATAGEVRAQGGLSDPSSPAHADAAAHVKDAVAASRDVIEAHAVRFGLARALEDEGVPFDSDLMGRRAKALKAARAAADKVGDVERGMAKLDPKFFGALDDLHEATADLDRSMRFGTYERELAVSKPLGRPEDVAGYGRQPMSVEEALFGNEDVPIQNLGLNDRMRDPAVRTKYKEIYGHDWVDLPEGELPAQPAQMAKGTPEGFAPPGAKTGPARPGAMPEPEALGPEAPGPVLEPSPRESSDTAALRQARPINPAPGTVESENALNQAYHRGVLHQLPDGYFVPPADVRQVADMFSRFADRMAEDTQAVRARKAASLEALRQGGAPGTPAPGNVVSGQPAAAQGPSAPSASPGGSRGDLDALNRALGVGAPRQVPEHVVRWLDGWHAESTRLGPSVTPGDLAAARISRHVDALYEATGGRADAVAAMELGPKYGLPEARSPLGERAQQVALLRKAGEAARDLATGGKSGKGPAASWLKRRFFGKAGAMAGGAIIGGHFAGEAGYLLGASLAGGYADTASRVAGSAGRAMLRVSAAAESLLAGHRGAALASATVNRPRAYGPDGPERDPVKRALQLKQLAGSPDAIRSKVRAQLGDLTAVHPGLARSVEDTTVLKVTAIAAHAPLIMFDQLGGPMAVPAQALRHFLEYENAAHDPDTVVEAIGRGSASRTQVDALRETAPNTYAQLLRASVGDPSRLRDLNREALRVVETQLGVPLTAASNRGFLGRGQANWARSVPQAQPPQGSPRPTGRPDRQAAGQATETESLNGRAPGN